MTSIRRDSTASTLPALPLIDQQVDSNEMTVFFHADATTRKARLPSNLGNLTMDDVCELFIRTMKLPRYVSKKDLPPFYIQDRNTKIEYELVRARLCLAFWLRCVIYVMRRTT